MHVCGFTFSPSFLVQFLLWQVEDVRDDTELDLCLVRDARRFEYSPHSFVVCQHVRLELLEAPERLRRLDEPREQVLTEALALPVVANLKSNFGCVVAGIGSGAVSTCGACSKVVHARSTKYHGGDELRNSNQLLSTFVLVVRVQRDECQVCRIIDVREALQYALWKRTHFSKVTKVYAVVG